MWHVHVQAWNCKCTQAGPFGSCMEAQRAIPKLTAAPHPACAPQWVALETPFSGPLPPPTSPVPAHLERVAVLAVVPRLLPAHAPLHARVLRRVQLDLMQHSVRSMAGVG